MGTLLKLDFAWTAVFSAKSRRAVVDALVSNLDGATGQETTRRKEEQRPPTLCCWYFLAAAFANFVPFVHPGRRPLYLSLAVFFFLFCLVLSFLNPRFTCSTPCSWRPTCSWGRLHSSGSTQESPTSTAFFVSDVTGGMQISLPPGLLCFACLPYVYRCSYQLLLGGAGGSASLLLLPQLLLPTGSCAVYSRRCVPVAGRPVCCGCFLPSPPPHPLLLCCLRFCFRFACFLMCSRTTLYLPCPLCDPFCPFFTHSRPGVRHRLLHLRLRLQLRGLESYLLLLGLGRHPGEGRDDNPVPAAGGAAAFPRGARSDGRRARPTPTDAARLGVAGRQPAREPISEARSF